MDNPGRRLKLVAEKGVKKYQKVGAELSALVKKEMDAGNGRIKIARKLGLSPNTIGKVMERIKSRDGCIARKKGSGRPRSACTPSNIAEISRIVSADPKRSLTKIAGEVGMARSSAHRATRSHLKKKSIRAVKSPNLTPKNKADRVEKANEFARKIDSGVIRVEDIVFTNEKLFSRGQLLAGSTQNSRIWLEMAVSKKTLCARDLVVGKKRWSSSVMVAAAVSHKGCLEPRIIERGVKINAPIYLEMVQNTYAPGMALLYGGMKKFTFTQDNAPARTESATRRYPGQPGGRAQRAL